MKLPHRVNEAVLAWLFALLGFAFLSHTAQAQCGVLLQEESTLPGDIQSVRSHLIYDFDGPGPLPPEMLVGADRGRVFAWNGTRWRQLGSPLIDPGAGSYTTANDPYVHGLFTFRGELWAIMSGFMSNTNGSLFRWTGTTWQAISRTSPCGTITGWFLRATVWNDQIVVVGQRLACETRRTVALTYDGTRWGTLGDVPANDTDVAGGVLGTSSGRLLVGGGFSSSILIKELVGSTWVARCNGDAYQNVIPVQRLQEIGGNIYACGSTVLSSARPATVIQETPQGWQSIVPTSIQVDVPIACELRIDGENYTYVGGDEFTDIGGLVEWGPGYARSHYSPTGTTRFVGGLERYGNALFLFGGYNGGTTLPVLLPSATRPPTWQRLPGLFESGSGLANGAAMAITPAGVMLAGGSMCASSPNPPGCTYSPSFVRSGSQWNVPGEVLNGEVSRLVPYAGDVVAIGAFSRAGTRVLSTGVARWANGQWNPIGPATNPFSTTPSDAEALGDELYVCEYNIVSTNINMAVRRWNGSNWARYTSTLQMTWVSTDSSRPSLAIVNGAVHIGYRTGVYRWNGLAWTRLGDDATTPIARRLGRVGADVIVVGSGVWRWNGTGWETYGTIPGTGNPYFTDVFETSGQAYLIGAGVSPRSPLMRLEAGQWVPVFENLTQLRPGVINDAAIYAACAENQTIYLGGLIGPMGGFSYEYYARAYVGPPRVLTPPRDTFVRFRTNAYFSIEPEVYHDTLQTYRWRRNGVTLTDGLQSSRAVVAGSSSPHLRISLASRDEVGTYDCVIMNACGTTTTSAGVLSVTCPADMDNGTYSGTPDGGVTTDDLLYYLDQYVQGLATADIDDGSGIGIGDGGVTIDDLLYFLAAFAQGC